MENSNGYYIGVDLAKPNTEPIALVIKSDGACKALVIQEDNFGAAVQKIAEYYNIVMSEEIDKQVWKSSIFSR